MPLVQHGLQNYGGDLDRHLKKQVDEMFSMLHRKIGEISQAKDLAISEFPKWRKYLISQSFRDKSSVRPVQVGGFEANIVVHRSTAVRGRGGPPPPWESSCRTRTGPVEADGTVDAQNAPTAPWKTLRVFHELPQGLSHRITHAKPRKAQKWRWETEETG